MSCSHLKLSPGYKVLLLSFSSKRRNEYVGRHLWKMWFRSQSQLIWIPITPPCGADKWTGIYFVVKKKNKTKYATVHKFVVSKFLFKEISTLIQQKCIKLIKNDIKDIYHTKKFSLERKVLPPLPSLKNSPWPHSQCLPNGKWGSMDFCSGYKCSF